MLDVHRLRLLRELSRQGTIAATARACSLTPSAVSQQLAVLEREAGAPPPDKKEPAPFELSLELPAGNYRIEWMNTLTGKIESKEVFKHEGGEKKLSSLPYSEEIAIRIVVTN